MSMNETKSKSAVWWMVGTIVCLLVIGFFLLTDEPSDRVKSDEVNQMQEKTMAMQGLEADVKKKESEMKVLANQYQQKTGTPAPIELKTLDLGPEEKKLLEQAIGNEKDVSTRSLLQEILHKRDEISVLKTKIVDIERQLPSPHIAKKGENHYQVALAFLVNEKGLTHAQAKDMLARTTLFEELAEGFKVWNFYNGYEYGTFVTQGDAIVSPNSLVFRAKKKLIADYGQVVSERDQLVQSNKSMEEKQKELGEENEQLASRVNELDKQLNSMYYRLDLQKNLEKKGVLKRAFLSATKVNDISPSQYDRSMDLTIEDELVISADELGVGKIKNVVLFPKSYKKGSSYKVLITPNQKHALLTLMDKNRFKSERVVIAVR